MHISSLRSSGNSAFRCTNCEQVPPSHARPNLANLTKNFRDPFCSLVGKDGAHRNGLVLTLRLTLPPLRKQALFGRFGQLFDNTSRCQILQRITDLSTP